MLGQNLHKSGLLVIGFLVLAGSSLIFTWKQAAVVDAMGDVASVRAEINELQQEARESDYKEKNKDKIEKLRDEELPAQAQDAQDALAALPNGAVLLTLLSQIGATIFGLGVISIFLQKEENERIRATALLIIGGMAFVLIAARFIYLIIGGGSSVGRAAM